MHPTRPLLSLSAKTPLITPFTRRLFRLPLPPPPPSASHNDLPSFLAYATRTNLPASTTTYQGTLYEYTVQSHLRNLAFALHRVGGRSDLGIDLSGTWHVGANQVLDPPIRVIVQCKALKAKIGPHVVRELEGVTARHVPRGAGVLVSPREATRGVREALGRSGMPLIWMMVEWSGRVRQVLWNGKVEGLGLAGLGVEVRYFANANANTNANANLEEGGDGGGSEEARLTWDGGDIQTMDEVEEGMRRAEEEWMAKWEEKGLGDVPREEVLDAVERVVPGTRPIMISEQEREMVVRRLVSA
ncbi:hypothetical protein BJX61DRAFT_543832 [Aspergillus egyptiacus]|nr:hypothetical protein BJX61DRAFT_543832 [Aspergillus egyptiacus]